MLIPNTLLCNLTSSYKEKPVIWVLPLKVTNILGIELLEDEGSVVVSLIQRALPSGEYHTITIKCFMN